MGIASNVFTAQGRLYAALIARKQTSGSALTGVPVDLGFPGTVQQPAHVWISGSMDPWQLVWAVSGLTTADETFDLPVICMATRTTGSYPVVRDECSALAAEVEAAVAADPFLGGCPINTAGVAQMQLSEALPAENVRQVQATVWVRVRTVAGQDG